MSFLWAWLLRAFLKTKPRISDFTAQGKMHSFKESPAPGTSLLQAHPQPAFPKKTLPHTLATSPFGQTWKVFPLWPIQALPKLASFLVHGRCGSTQLCMVRTPAEPGRGFKMSDKRDRRPGASSSQRTNLPTFHSHRQLCRLPSLSCSYRINERGRFPHRLPPLPAFEPGPMSCILAMETLSSKKWD